MRKAAAKDGWSRRECWWVGWWVGWLVGRLVGWLVGGLDYHEEQYPVSHLWITVAATSSVNRVTSSNPHTLVSVNFYFCCKNLISEFKS